MGGTAKTKNRMSRASGWLLAGAFGLSVSHCTSADVLSLTSSADDRLTLLGTYCTRRPVDLAKLTRVLFVIDSSRGMGEDDRTRARASAIQGVLERFKASPGILYGLIRFGLGPTQPVVETPVFTRDTAILDRAVSRLSPGDDLGDGHDFRGALSAALQFIVNDRVSNLENRDLAYQLVFVTDGYPGESGPAASVSVREAMELVESLKQNRVQFHGVMIDKPKSVAEEWQYLLEEMVRAGKGRYEELASADLLPQALSGMLEETSVKERFVRKTFFANNRNTVTLVGNGEEKLCGVPVSSVLAGAATAIVVDSDGDGLPDAIEEKLGSSATLADTDGDGLSDLVECRLMDDPVKVPGPGMAGEGPADRDGDGLNDAEEKLLGTNPERFDTDQDGMPDGLEVRFWTDPVSRDDRDDGDGDSLPNLDELMGHLDPRGFEQSKGSGGVLEDLRYLYEESELGLDGTSYCYGYEIQNIALRETQPSGSHAPGENVIELIGVDQPSQNPDGQGNLSRAEVKIVFKSPNFRKPNAAVLRFASEDFQ